MAKRKQNRGTTTAEKFETVYKSRHAVRYGDPIAAPAIGSGGPAVNLSKFSNRRQPKTVLVDPSPRVALTGNETIQRLISLLKSSKYKYTDAIIILNAPVFTAVLDAAVSRCVNHNDVGRLTTLLEILKETKWYKPLLLWACARCGIYFMIGRSIVRDGRITTSSAMRFYKSANAAPRPVQLAEYITAANVGTLRTVLRDQGIDKPGAKMNEEWWVRLNGSFGG